MFPSSRTPFIGFYNDGRAVFNSKKNLVKQLSLENSGMAEN